MESYTVIVFLVAAVALSVSDASTITRVGSGSYTDTLLGGIGRISNKVHARPAVVRSGFSECDGRICPIGTVCSFEFGVGRCVPRTVVAAVDTGYGSSNIALTDSYAAGVGRKARFLDNGYGNTVGVSACGLLAPECLSSPNDFNPVMKYTFDHSLNRCVRVSVCMTCANFNSVRENLFDSAFQCSRFCQ